MPGISKIELKVLPPYVFLYPPSSVEYLK